MPQPRDRGRSCLTQERITVPTPQAVATMPGPKGSVGACRRSERPCPRRRRWSQCRHHQGLASGPPFLWADGWSAAVGCSAARAGQPGIKGWTAHPEAPGTTHHTPATMGSKEGCGGGADAGCGEPRPGYARRSDEHHPPGPAHPPTTVPRPLKTRHHSAEARTGVRTGGRGPEPGDRGQGAGRAAPGRIPVSTGEFRMPVPWARSLWEAGRIPTDTGERTTSGRIRFSRHDPDPPGTMVRASPLHVPGR